MKRGLFIVIGFLAGCSSEVPTKAFEKVKERACACAPRDILCARNLIKDVTQLRELGSEPVDAKLAKQALDEALACATKIVPTLPSELDKAF